MRKRSLYCTKISEPEAHFIRIFISRPGKDLLPMVVSNTATIESVARQIEAHLWFDNFPQGQYTPINAMNQKFIKVFQLYDASNIPLPFLSKVSEVLEFDATVSVSDSMLEETMDEETKIISKGGSLFDVINTSTSNINEYEVSHAEDRLLAVLTNTGALTFFNEFCLREYQIENILFWVACQAFKTITDDQERLKNAREIISIFIKPNAPLCLNLEEEVREILLKTKDEDIGPNFLDDVQTFVFVLIKVHAYPRFELSDLFEKFLKFKQNDRYLYIQGKTTWQYTPLKNCLSNAVKDELNMIESILNDPESEKSREMLQSLTEDNGSTIDSAAFRQHVLFAIMKLYFPENKAIFDGYFDVEVRKEWRRKTLQKKQKILKKFFGTNITNSQMEQQNVSNDRFEKQLTETIHEDGDYDGGDEDVLDQDKRKKATKLAEFFGNNLSVTELFSQSLVEGTMSQQRAIRQEMAEREESKPAAPDSFIGVLNDLTAEEKMILTKRAKKLLMVLGNSADAQAIAVNAVQSNRSCESLNDLLTPDAVDKLSLDDEYDEKNNRKHKLDKLSHFLGERILPDHINEDAAGSVARPLTNKEKQIYRKKVDKLEKLLGSYVPTNEVVAYDKTMDESDSDADDMATQSSDSPDVDEEERRQRLLRIRKIQKIMGIKGPGTANVLSEQYLMDLEKSIDSVAGNSETKNMLKAEIQRIRSSTKKV